MRGKKAAASLAVVTMVLFLVPVAHAQPASAAGTGLNNPTKATPTSLYFHIFDIFNNFAINTQVQHPGFFKVGGTNFPTLIEPTTGQNYDFNTIYGFSTAGPVEYDFIENGQPRYHPEPGIAANVNIDGNAPAVVHLYVSLRDVLGSENANFLPSYTFRVEMRDGNVLGTDEALNSGNLIMHGEKTAHLARGAQVCTFNPVPPPQTCVGGENPAGNQTDPNGTPILFPNKDGIIEYAIPMTVDAKVIQKKLGFHMRIDWYQNPSGDPSHNDQAAEGYMRLVSNETYHPRLDLSVTNPIYVDFVHPEVAAGILLIHTAENSPWGTYDVDVRNITVGIQDKAGNDLHLRILDGSDPPNVVFDSGGTDPVAATLQLVISQNSHVHNLHNKSAEVTYLWRYHDEGAADGEYTIAVHVQNNAHTATATGTSVFVLEGKKAYGIDQGGNVVSAAPDSSTVKASPGAGLLVVCTVLGAALLLRRRGA
ncbi:MAG: hypothetical protein LC620_02215 [Halobacteriales archaeon]|nr:hypothetical protein [Halobacteriales archaeon]